MAIVHFVNYQKPQTSNTMAFVLRYTMQDEKTVADDGNKYVTGINCTPQSAYTEFNNTKRLYGKTDGRLFYHFVQSFSVDENISPQTAHEIAVRFAEETEKFSSFEIVVSTHCDRDHIHSHFVINSVNAESGKKFHISESEVGMLMQKSDALCREYGLSVLKPKPPTERAKPMNDREYRSAEKGESWKIRLEAVISNAMKTAASKEHFIMLMEAEGYGICIAVVCEVIHMILIFLTNMDDSSYAFEFVKGATVPMILGNAIAVGCAIIIVSLLSHERFTRNKGGERIANTFQRWLLLCIVVAYLVTSTFTFILQNGMVQIETQEVFTAAINDVEADVKGKSDAELLGIAEKVKTD